MKRLWLTLVSCAALWVASSFTAPFSPPRAFSQELRDGEPVAIGAVRQLHSNVLNEDRLLFVSLPVGYEKSSLSYPVLFVLYGDQVRGYLAEAVHVLDRLSGEGSIPPMIVVGVVNVDRYRDLSVIGRQGKESGVEPFLSFFADELVPFVEREYRTKSYRILVGPQAGAEFGLYALEKEKGLFNAVLIENPFRSQAAHEALTPAVNALLEQGLASPAFLQITYADRVGYLDMTEQSEYVRAFEKAVEARKPRNLRFMTRYIDRNEDFLPPPGLKEGLRVLFREYRFPANRRAQSLQDITGYYEALGGQLGFQVDVPEMTLVVAADDLNRKGQTEAAREMLEYLVRVQPASVDGYWRLANLHRERGDNAKAVEYYSECLELMPNMWQARDWIDKLTDAGQAEAGASPAAGEERRPHASASATDEPRSVTLPFETDHNRMIVEVQFILPDGTARPARAWVDTGNEVLLLSKPLARDLGVDVSAMTDKGIEAELPSPAALLSFGGLTVPLEGVKVEVMPGEVLWQGLPADFNLPVSLLRNEHLVLDYPARRFTVARPHVLEPKGVAVPCRVNPETGLFMIASVLDGDTVQLGIDNGSAGTWVSDSLTKAWAVRHPDWPRATGAAGSANFFGFPFESQSVLMCLPEIRIGAMRARDVGLLGLDQSFFDWYSRKSAGPVLGFIGSNVLKDFRVEVDLPNQMTYWTAGPGDMTRDLDIVGLTLRPEADSSFTVVGVVTEAGRPVVAGVLPGDKLVSVDGIDVEGSTMGTVMDALRGLPGSKHQLVVDRARKRITVQAEVKRLP